ncbi:MAG: hypothetical protein IJU16_05870 [Clostridia bacterium]|nr:hypothetical protein [Clostridia bacterium]
MAKNKAKKVPQTPMDDERQQPAMTAKKQQDRAENRMTQKAASEAPHCQETD